MGYIYTTIDGKRVEANAAIAFQKLRTAFQKAFPGLDLKVTWGVRTRAEQQRLYDLYRAGKGNLAAPPGHSDHEETGPSGPRAMDVHDTGRDAGVTVLGSKRALWLKKNAPTYGFKPTGYSYSQQEPWHIHYTGKLATSTPAKTSSGKLAVDGSWGAATTKALQKALGVTQDGVMGPVTIKALQRKVKVTADGKIGPNTRKALQRYLGVAQDGVWGVKTVKALQTRLNKGF